MTQPKTENFTPDLLTLSALTHYVKNCEQKSDFANNLEEAMYWEQQKRAAITQTNAIRELLSNEKDLYF